VISFIGVTNILTIIAASFLNAKIVISERNDPSRQSLGLVWNILRKITYPFADVVTANSRNALISLGNYIPSSKLILVPNPITLPTNVKFKNKEFYLLAVGRLHKQKSFDLLINSFSIIVSSGVRCRLIILGDGGERDNLKKLSEDLNVSELIVWPGHVSDPFVYYNPNSIFIIPSQYEGMPNALIEAMGMGMACIVSDVVGSVDTSAFIDNYNCLYFDSGNDFQLAKTIEKLINNHELRSILGGNASDTIHSNFSIKKSVDSWNQVFSILNK
jgi:glycosyltransferase involved in cell wall biosynthesis